MFFFKCSKQRIYISDRRDSTGHRLTKMWLTQPLPALSAVYSTTWPSARAGRERLGESHLCKTMAIAVPSITNIYSLTQMISFVSPLYCLHDRGLTYVLYTRPKCEPCQASQFSPGLHRNVQQGQLFTFYILNIFSCVPKTFEFLSLRMSGFEPSRRDYNLVYNHWATPKQYLTVSTVCLR